MIEWWNTYYERNKMTDFAVDRVAENGVDFHSDSIETVAYDAENKTLFVEFSHGSAAYAYSDVEESTYNLFITAPSLNRFWRDHISGDAERYDFADFYLRESEGEVDLQPETKWLSVPEGQTPDFATGREDVTEDFLSAFKGDTPTVDNGRFGVKWTNGSLTFEPEFNALSEADALVQFNAAMESASAVGFVTEDSVVKILAVTHYLS